MKVTETRLDTLIDNLNTLICEDDLLILVSIFSGFPRNWGERRSASPVKSRRKDI